MAIERHLLSIIWLPIYNMVIIISFCAQFYWSGRSAATRYHKSDAHYLVHQSLEETLSYKLKKNILFIHHRPSIKIIIESSTLELWFY